MKKGNDVYKENYEMRKKIEEMKSDFSSIVGIIVCIGGPLNDDVRGYSPKQLKPFSDILNIARYWEGKPNER